MMMLRTTRRRTRRLLRAAALAPLALALAPLALALALMAPALPLAHALPTARAQDKSTTKAVRGELKNGLRLILRPVEGVKDVSVVVLYDIGGDLDPRGRSGMAHLLEHVYVTAAAGSTPARTAADFFQRYERQAELVDAAARMGDLKIEEADLERERPRLVEEVANMFGRMPMLGAQNLAGERVRPTPHGGRKGGLPGHVAAITVEEMHERWKRYYKPRNATLVLTGAIDPDGVAALVKKHFGEIPSGDELPEAPEIETPDEPKGSNGTPDEIEVTPLQTGQKPIACIGLRGPRPGDGDHAAFVVGAVRLMVAAFGGGAGHPDGITVGWTPIDDPERLRVAGPLKQGESPEEGIARLDAWMKEVLAPDLAQADRVSIANNLGFFFWPETYPDAFLQNLYGLGFGLGRHRQLGHDPVALDEALGDLKPVDFRRVVDTMFLGARRSAIVVKPTR